MKSKVVGSIILLVVIVLLLVGFSLMKSKTSNLQTVGSVKAYLAAKGFENNAGGDLLGGTLGFDRFRKVGQIGIAEQEIYLILRQNHHISLNIPQESRAVYDILNIKPYSYCSECANDLYTGHCKYSDDRMVFGVYSLDSKKVYQAWDIDKDTLKFKAVPDLLNVTCGFD